MTEYKACDRHEWAGLGDCPECEAEERRADYIEAEREDRRINPGDYLPADWDSEQ